MDLKKVKYVHIIPNNKFDEAFIKFTNKYFPKEEHLFLVYYNDAKKFKEYNTFNTKKFLYNKGKLRILRRIINVVNFFRFTLFYLIKCKNKEKIFIHHMYTLIGIFLYIFRKYLKISYWIIWGAGDKPNEKLSILEKIDKYVKGNFYAYTTEVRGDYQLIKKWYGAKGKYYSLFLYPSNLYKSKPLLEKQDKTLYIQVGNSAEDCNNHLEILEKLKKYKTEDIKIFCPLSYGENLDKNYKKKIILKGKEIFGSKFIPMLTFLDYEDYMKFISKIDIAIFAHNKQKAMGNITSLLSMEKTVYLKENTSTYKFLKELEVQVKKFNKLEKLELFSKKILKKNKQILKKNYSEETLKGNLEKVFYN